MAVLQLPCVRIIDYSSSPLLRGSKSSSFWGRDLCFGNGGVRDGPRPRASFNGRLVKVFAMSDTSSSSFKMNLNEYMVTLEKPLGIRFAISVDGRIFVHSLKKGVLNFFS